MNTGPSVLYGDEAAEQADYRDAVAEIIGDILREERIDGEPINIAILADSIDASTPTISNAKNKKSTLSQVHLTRLGKRFGAGYLNPYFRLMGAQAAPLDDSLTADILPLIMAVGHKIACARDPEGPGGTTEVPQERRSYLPDLKRLNNRSGCLIKEIEEATA